MKPLNKRSGETSEPFDTIITIDTDYIVDFANQNDNLYSSRTSYQKAVGAPDMPTVSILVFGYNNLHKHTKKCVESILKYTDIDYELVLLDNGSSDGTFEYFKTVTHKKKKIIKITKNRGANYGVYQGLKYLSGRYAVLVANDVYVTRNWLSNILKCVESDERIGFVATASDFISNLQAVDIGYKSIEDMYLNAEKHNISDPRKWEERLRLMPAIGFYKKECLDIVGSVDYVFQHDFGDDDISIRIRRAGYKLVFCGDVFVHHAGPSATDQTTGQKAELLKTGREIFRQKYYGIDAWEDINNFEMLMLTLVNPEDKRGVDKPEILGIDIKCGTPILQLKNKLRQADVFDTRLSAFVQDAKYWLDLKTICEGQVVVDRIQYLAEHFSTESFDYIILGNPLYSYPEKENLLKTLLSLLKADGQLLIKLNNTFNMQAFLSSMNKGLGTGQTSITGKEISDLNALLQASGFSISAMVRSLHNIDQKEKDVVLELLKNAGHTQNVEAVYNELLTEIYALKITHHKLRENAETVDQSSRKAKDHTPGFTEKSVERNIDSPVSGKPENSSLPASFTNQASSNLTSIIVVTHNRLEKTKKCLKSIRKHTPEPHEIIFVDNASTDSTVKWLQSQVKENENYHLIENKENLGAAKGRNQGIVASRGEYILLLESDVIVGPEWLSGLLACYRHAPDAGIVGPMSNNGVGLQQVPDANYRSVDYLDKLAEQFKNKHRNRRILSRKIAGFCMLFARPLVEKIGLLDENLGDIILPAEDFCWRSVLAEQRNYVAGDVFVHHYSTEAPCDRSNFNKKWALSMATPEGKKLAVLKAMELADTYHSKGQMDPAVETLVNCIKYAPDEPLIYFELARLFIEVKKYAEARDVVTSMPQAAQDAIKGLECAACAREGLGLDDEAAVLVEKMLSLHSQYPPAINLLGVLSYKKGDKEKAKEFFQQAIEADPGYGEAYTNLGVLYWGIEQREEAFGNLKKGFLLSPALPDASSLYYSVVSSLDRFSQAEDDFAEACRLHPQNKNLVFLYIDILIQQEKFDSAILRIQDALTTFGLDEGTLNAALAVRDRIGPLQIEKSGKKGTLSLCMIVKNEEKHLAKCLKSVRDVVDEMIIVDTGSTDKTKDIAKVFGAKLYDFPWTGDFSAARNESLAHATGDWVLILDADEVISSMDYPEIRELMRKDKPRPAAYSIVTRNYLDDSSILGWTPNKGEYPEESGRGWLPSPKVRLLSRRPDIYFTYPVHETLENSLVKAGVPIMPSKIVVHHYGKLAVADDLHKGELYYLLGLTKLESDPNNFNHILELARQALTLKRYEESIDLSLRLRDLAKTDAHARAFIRTNRPFNIDLEAEIYLLLSSAYLPLNRFAEALEVAKQAALISPDRKEIIQCYANCEVVSGSLDKAYQTLYELLMEAPDYPAAQLLLAIIFCLKGEHEKMENLFRILLSRGFSITDAMNLMAERYIIQNRNEEARLILHTIKKHKLGNIKTDELLDTTET